ncbi:aldehyde dehydrogenase family protein [Enteractinococcus helveticum]|uniref:Betaine-aldehyde dehydrogenase n=1 Tax=Enteractinococcus helveticum TaxID=1837282 RepID=A0A1B7M1F5_9MICC|nr:aldehyde dehydrogenase family protein [Enteractinococcus helveticum]OAV62438.1 betaine-aldehyde dehydrogenase [Enteractinococcus helveticum]
MSITTDTTNYLSNLLIPSAYKFATQKHGSFIEGTKHSINETSIDIIDPSTGRVITQVSETDEETVDRAVLSAKRAFDESWGHMAASQREASLHRLADLIEENAAELAQYDALEGGKPVSQVETVDLPLAIEQFRYYAGWPTKLRGDTVPAASASTAHVFTHKKPRGVVAAITPWNFPLCQAAIKIAPALAAGNTVVLKPSELTSLSSLRLAELAMEAGLPAGTLNVVTGTGANTGHHLVSHPAVNMISFTGSEKVGRHIAGQAGQDLKPVALELGGKNPNIILPDADIAKAAQYAATTAYFYSGQVCFSGSRLMVDRSVLDEVLEAIQTHAEDLVLGHGLDRSTTMGPLSSDTHRNKVEGYLEEVTINGGEIAFGGLRPEKGNSDGFFLQPTAIVGPPDITPAVEEEIFGPVLIVQPFDDIEEVITRANKGKYGLSAGLWTNDVRNAHRISQRLEAGTVWVNTYSDWHATAPFGGFKNSGMGGKDNGAEGIEKFLDTQTIWMSLE